MGKTRQRNAYFRSYNANPARKEYIKKYREEHKEERKEYRYEYNRRPEVKEKQKARQKANRETPEGLLIGRLRCRLNAARMVNSKTDNTKEYIGLPLKKFVKYIEGLFTDKMTWDNTNEWHIDHFIPVKFFDHSDELQVKLCWHYTNLQPMLAEDNLHKGSVLPLLLVYLPAVYEPFTNSPPSKL